MRKGIYAVSSLLLLTNALNFTSLPETSRETFKIAPFWGQAFDGDFDYRDQDNQLVSASADIGEDIQDLFLFSAWNLLMLAETPPKTMRDSLFSIGRKVVWGASLLMSKALDAAVTIALGTLFALRRHLLSSATSLWRTGFYFLNSSHTTQERFLGAFHGASLALRI